MVKDFFMLDGRTPVPISIGNVQTLSPDDSAYANLRLSSDCYLLDLGIPQGAAGTAGKNEGAYIDLDSSNIIDNYYLCVAYNPIPVAVELIGIGKVCFIKELTIRKVADQTTNDLVTCFAIYVPSLLASADVDEYTGTYRVWFAGGLQGPEGPAGAMGPSTIAWHTSQGQPAVGIGGSGDFYLDTITGDLYRRGMSSWVSKMTIMGEPGSAGPSGAAGPPGATFYPIISNGWLSWSKNGGLTVPSSTYVIGPPGSDGTNGRDGLNGINGLNGSNGKDGVNGNKWYTTTGCAADLNQGDMAIISGGDIYQYQGAGWEYVMNIVEYQGNRWYVGTGTTSGLKPGDMAIVSGGDIYQYNNIGGWGASVMNIGGVTFTPSVNSSGVLSWANSGGLENPSSVNIMGPAGVTFSPSVSSDGWLRWTNNGGLENPSSVNIMGSSATPGVAGVTFIPSVTDGVLSWTNNGSLTNPDPVDITGPAGPSGVTYTPSVDASGNLSWTKNGGEPASSSVCIMGPSGSPGSAGNKWYTTTATGEDLVPGDMAIVSGGAIYQYSTNSTWVSQFTLGGSVAVTSLDSYVSVYSSSVNGIPTYKVGLNTSMMTTCDADTSTGSGTKPGTES